MLLLESFVLPLLRGFPIGRWCIRYPLKGVSHFPPNSFYKNLLSLCIMVFSHHNTRIYVRLLGPCFKTGRLRESLSSIFNVFSGLPWPRYMIIDKIIPQKRFLPFCCETTLNNQEDQVGKKNRAFGFPSKFPFPFWEKKNIEKKLIPRGTHFIIPWFAIGSCHSTGIIF